MQAIVQGLATNYERVGTGRQILLLHGWGDSSRSWQRLAKDLSQKYEVIMPDLPGFGGTEAPRTTWGLSEYAQFVSDFAAKSGLKPYAVFGHSNGGAIAVRAIGLGLLKPNKLVLLASAGIRGEAKGRNSALKIIAKTGKVVAMSLPASARNKLRRKLYQASGSDMLVAEHLQDTFKQVVSEDVRKDASRVSISALLVYGSKDTSTPVRFGELLAQEIKGSKLEVVPGAGHFVHLDAESEVKQLVEEFLK